MPRLEKNITPTQKLAAISHKYYQHAVWEPKIGDYYTIVRNDAKLFQIVGEELMDDVLTFVVHCNEYDDANYFRARDFTTDGFGLNRVWVPDWIFASVE